MFFCYFFKTSFKTVRVIISSALTVVYDVLKGMVWRGLNVREELGDAKVLQGLCDYICVIFERRR